MLFANGLSVARGALSVTRTQSGRFVAKALRMSSSDVGVPLVMIRPGCRAILDGSRTSAVSVWPFRN